MREAIEMLVRGLVDEKDAVDVREVEAPRATVIEIRVAASDVGKLIGRQGSTVRALRTVLHAASLKHGRRYALEIVEDER